MFVDPSINTTGIAIYNCWEQQGQVESSLVESDVVIVDKADLSTWARVLIMCERIIAYKNQHNVQRIFIEEPPGTIYQGQMSRDPKQIVNQLIGRANKIFKLTAVAYGLLGLLQNRQSKEVRTFLPIDWEPHPSHRKGLPIKEWSLWHANLILAKKQFPLLKTSVEENIADAINQGYFLLQKFASGKKEWS